MIRRTYSGAQPNLTANRDDAEPACAGRWDVYDVLIDPRREDRGSINHALKEARDLCDSCPIKAACHAENADEPWLKLVQGFKPNTVSEQRRTTNQQRHDMRLTMLEALIAADSPFDRVLRWMGMTETQLYKWCHWHQHLDLWAELTPHKQPNQHRAVAS